MTKTSDCKNKHKDRKLITDCSSLIHKEGYGPPYYFDKENMILELQTSTSEIHYDQSHLYSNLFSGYTNVMFSQKYFTNENKLTTCGLRMSQKPKKEVWMCIKNQQLKTHLSENRRGYKQCGEANN